MKKMGKKSLIITLAAISAAVGITAGAVLAQDDDEATPEARQVALLERVCEVYEDNTGVAIDADELREAFVTAAGEIRDEAQEARLEQLVEAGVITADEAEEIREWMDAKPNIDCPQCPFFGGGPAGRMGPRMNGFGPGGQEMGPEGGPGMMGPWNEFTPDTEGV